MFLYTTPASSSLFISWYFETSPSHRRWTSAEMKSCTWSFSGVNKTSAWVIISVHQHLVQVRLIGKVMEINNQSHICKVGLVFTYRKVKDGCTYYTSASSQKRISTPTITVLTEFFPLLIKGNKVLPLLPPLHIFLAQLMRLQTAHPTDTQHILPRSLHNHPFSFSPFSPLISIWFPADSFSPFYGSSLHLDTTRNEMFNY